MTASGHPSRITSDVRPWVTYTEGLAVGALRFQRCAECARAIFYPRLACPFCGSADIVFEVSAGTGTVYTMTVIPEREGDDYCVALVDLDEGFRMITNIVGVAPEAVAIGMRVQVRFATTGDGEPVAVFAPVEQAA